MFSFPTDPSQPPSELAVVAGLDPAATGMGAMEPMAVLEGELLPPEEEEEEYSEPAPRPIDWRVRKYWSNPEARRTLGRWLCEEIRMARTAIQWRLDNAKEWRDAHEMMPSAPDSPYPGAATCCAPFTRYACDAHTRQLNAQIVEPEPVVTADPLDAEAMEVATEIEEAMNGRIDDSEWAREARSLHKDLPVLGNGYLRVEYERRVKRVPRLQIDQDPEEYLQAYQALLLARVDPLTAQLQALKRDANGAIKYRLGWEEIVEYSGAGYKFVNFEDGVVFPATCRNAAMARGIGERFVISGLDLAKGAKDGLFIQSEVDALLEMPGDDLTRSDGTDDRDERLEHQGIEVTGDQGPLADSDAKYREYLCWRLSLRLDGNDDGEEEILLVTLHEESERILDIRYSQYEHGEHIYHLANFEPRPGELLGIGIAETIAVLQDEGTALLNQLCNHRDLAINASICPIVDDTAMLDPDIQRLEMGTIFRVRDQRGVREFPIASLPPEAYAEFQRIKDHVDLIAGVSNPSLGKGTDIGRTAREVMVVESHASANFEEVSEGQALFWARVWDQVRSIEAQFARDGQVKYRRNRMARAAAQDPQQAFGSIDAEVLLKRVRILPAGLRQLSDRQSRFSLAMAMNNAFQANPITANLPEVWEIAIEYTMEAADYPSKEKVMLAIQRAKQQAAAAAAAQQQAMMNAGFPPEMMQVISQLPPEFQKALVEQMQSQGQAAPAPTSEPVNAEATGMSTMPGAAGPEQGGPIPGVLG